MKYLALSFLLLLTACGGDYKETVPEGSAAFFHSQKVTSLSGNLSVEPNRISGVGAALFDSSLREFRDGGSYALDFTLADGGALTLVSHADAGLAGGYELEFRRAGSGAGSLKVTLRAQGSSRDTINQPGFDVFSGVDAAGPLQFQIDVHNDEAPAHSLVWSRLINDDFSEAASILNTEDDLDKSHGSPGNGAGIRWGLRLSNAQVTRAELGDTKFED